MDAKQVFRMAGWQLEIQSFREALDIHVEGDEDDSEVWRF